MKRRQVIDIPKKPKSKSKHKKVKLWEKYEVKEGKIIRKNKFCPKCKSFLAEMKNKLYCGKCGYVEIKKNSDVEKEIINDKD